MTENTGARTTVVERIAAELAVGRHQVQAAVDLLDGGATVPFVARYRKEATGGLDDIALRTLAERLVYLRELEERRTAILESVESQGKLDDALRAQIMAADSKARLEDVYLPFRPKRRTKAAIAREAGLEPLADALLADPRLVPLEAAAAYVDEGRGVPDAGVALEGARSILAERFSENADLVGSLRERMWSSGRLVSRVREGREADGAKFADYFDATEPLTRLKSHRVLALFRGEKEGVLELEVLPDPASSADNGGGGEGGGADPLRPGPYVQKVADAFGIRDSGRPADPWLRETARWAWRTRILPRLEVDLRLRLRQAAEDEAVRVFAANLRDLLLAAPAGMRPTLGLDPGLRTGVKVAVVDGTGRVVAVDTIYPHEPRRQWDASIATLARLCAEHRVELVAIGNGTASRETDKLAADLMHRHPQLGLTRAVVSEAGASVYSASAYASQELPELDVSLRGAVSIARRLQDPLAELVKIDPRSIGVGQYQHDVAESALARSLDGVVEDCVNAVGVDVNTASVPLLTRVSGITEGLAENIVRHRDTAGPFRTRRSLKDVPRLGPKAFEQCAGFLRISGGDDPLDRSAVHPEAYPVVHRILQFTGTGIGELLGNGPVLTKLDAARFIDERFGLPTVQDILAELDKPGRDPRPAFTTARFAAGVEKIGDLKSGMVLEGVVTNVAAFGAFVDVGVHQDGLVHVSAMSRSFVSDPRDVVRPGDVVRVRVLSVDVPRKRIGLSLLLENDAGAPQREGGARGEGARQGGGRPQPGGRGGGPQPAGRPQPGGRRQEPGGRRQEPGGRRQELAPDAGGAIADALRRAGYKSE